MAAPKLTNRGASASADAVTALLANGYLRIYSGTKPATADTAISGNTLLAELRFGATAFASAVNGVATANAITDDASANNTGTATWFRCLDSGGVDVTDNVFDGDVSATGGGGDLQLATTSLVAGGQVGVTALTYTQGKG